MLIDVIEAIIERLREMRCSLVVSWLMVVCCVMWTWERVCARCLMTPPRVHKKMIHARESGVNHNTARAIK